MGKKSPPSNVTTTSKNENVIDPDFKNRILGNLDMTQLLTSGMLPQQRPGTTTSLNGSQPGVTGFSGGQSINIPGVGEIDLSALSSGGAATPAGPAVNADGSPFVPPSTFTAGFDPSQIEAMRRIESITGDGSNWATPDTFGQDVYNKFKNWQAPTVNTPGAYQAAQATSQNFTDLDFEKYLMPGREQVISPLTKYFDEMGERAVASTASKGALGSSVRGSNDALREGTVRGEIALNSGPTISNALQNLYSTSAGLATGDLNRSADTSRYNAGLTTQASRDDYMGRLQAAMANAGYKAAEPGVQMGAAGAAGQAKQQSYDFNINNTALLDQVGREKRGLAQDRLMDPFKALQLQSAAITGNAPLFTGQSGTQTGPSPYGKSGGVAGAIGGAAGAAGLASMAGLGGTAGLAASPWLWPILLGGGALGAFG